MDSIVSGNVLRSYGDSRSNCRPQRRSVRLSDDDIRPRDWAHHTGASVGLDSSDNTVPVNRRLWPSALNNELSSTGSAMKRHPVPFTCISLWLVCCEEFNKSIRQRSREYFHSMAPLSKSHTKAVAHTSRGDVLHYSRPQRNYAQIL